MSNTYFRFKQFTVHQDRAAMKVCTDACLFGAWIAHHIQSAAHVLDIGTGTGLLTLMYAQQHSESLLDAVELDSAAAKQAEENSKASPWSKRIKVYATSIQQFHPGHSYDLIIANPPFFENDLRSADTGRNNAMHDTALTLEELSDIIPRHLSPFGHFAVLLPDHRRDYFISLMLKRDLHLQSGLQVKQSPQHDYFRSILCFAQQRSISVQEEEIVIREDKDRYSEKFASLLKEYYLYL